MYILYTWLRIFYIYIGIHTHTHIYINGKVIYIYIFHFFQLFHLFQHSEINSHNVPETQILLCFEGKGMRCSFSLVFINHKIRMTKTG